MQKARAAGLGITPIVNHPGPNHDEMSRNPTASLEYGVPLGILDDDPGVRPEFHNFVGSKASWFEITDDLPQNVRFAPKKA